MSESNIESLQRLDRLFQAVDFEAARSTLMRTFDTLDELDEPLRELGQAHLELLDPDVEIDISTYRMGFSGGDHWHGLAGWWAFWQEWLEGWEGFSFEASDHEQIGDHVVRDAVITAQGRSSGVPVEWRQVQVWSFRGGKLIGLRPFESREDAKRWIEAESG